MSTVASSGMPTRNLLRILGLAFGIAMVVGSVVGMGILRTVAVMAAAVPLFRYLCPARLRPVASDTPRSSP
jgi:hypothetical protein